VAHWAELDENNVVIRVLKTDNEDPNGDEGYQWLIDNLGGRWIQTSYNAFDNGFRKKFAGATDVYDEDNDWFIGVTPYPSWIFDEERWYWVAPVDYPTDGKTYKWDENTVSWQIMDLSG